MTLRLSLEGKFIVVILCCVFLAVAVLTGLIIRRETELIRSVHRKNAETVAESIATALRDNMLSGRPAETRRLIGKLSAIEGVTGLSVLGKDFKPAFDTEAPVLGIGSELISKLNRGENITIFSGGAQHLMKPLLNEPQCRACHSSEDALRGIIIVRTADDDIKSNTFDLIRRMSAFTIFIAAMLSAALAVFSRRMLLTPIKGLTEAAKKVASGDFTLFRPRTVRCSGIMGCGNSECPSFNDSPVPCWLQSQDSCLMRLNEERGPDACLECPVFIEHGGDEMTQLQDNFNRMSMNLKSHAGETKKHIAEIEELNRELTKSNVKLSTLLESSRLTTSTLELDQTLSTSLKIILNVTHLKAGVILLLEENLTEKCYEYFNCDAYNCPAYKSDINCWRLNGTACHGARADCPHGLSAQECWNNHRTHSHYLPVTSCEEKIKVCSNCDFFSRVVLIPKLSSGVGDGLMAGRIGIDSGTIHKALIKGLTLVDYSRENPFKIPMEPATEIAMPLMIKDQITGVLYMASDEKLTYTQEEVEFFQFLSEVISSGILNSRMYEEMETSYFETVMTLSNAIEAKDPYTRGHSERVADISLKIADALHLSRQEKEHLRFAAILHDVGKIGISRELLRKDGRLEKHEREEVMSHPERAMRILEPIKFLKPSLPAIRHHHESFEGKGYPFGLRGRDIPFKARIICAADAWDAMRSDRPYRAALSIEIAKTDVQFDPEIIDALMEVV